MQEWFNCLHSLTQVVVIVVGIFGGAGIGAILIFIIGQPLYWLQNRFKKKSNYIDNSLKAGIKLLCIIVVLYLIYDMITCLIKVF